MTDLSRIMDAIDSMGRYAATPYEPPTVPVPSSNPFIESPSEHCRLNGGDQWKFKFANGYGASVINSPMAYGGNRGLYELAVLDSDGHLCYDTPITDDVLGDLTVDDVREALRQIAELPS